MRALQLAGIGRLELVELQPPAIGPDEVLIRTGASTICTSDLIDMRSNPSDIALPVVIGHEGAGTVAAVGSSVGDIGIGARVAAHPVHPCGTCPTCLSGLAHLCPAMRHFGVNMQGTFAEYFVARADRVRVLPSAVDIVAATLLEPLCVCLEALLQARLSPGASLLIVGDGPFGLIMAHLADGRGLVRLVLAGQHDFRLAHAGTAVTINTTRVDDPRRAVLEETDGGGYDAVILAVGSRPAAAMALDVLRPRGRLIVFAALHGQTPLDLASIHRKELEIVGSCNDRDLINDALQVLARNEPWLPRLITHRFPVTAYQRAFALAERGQREALKVAVVF